jgi:hypothetical protein
MVRRITADSRLSELRELAHGATPSGIVSARMVRSIQQSMRVEGYPVTEDQVRSSAERVLRTAGE